MREGVNTISESENIEWATMNEVRRRMEVNTRLGMTM
jgi:hypothetical protein